MIHQGCRLIGSKVISSYMLKVVKKAVLRELRPDIVEKEKEKERKERERRDKKEKDDSASTGSASLKVKVGGKEVEKDTKITITTHDA